MKHSTIQNNLRLTLASIFFMAVTAEHHAQITRTQADKNWEIQLQAGLNSFQTSGIPMSRNQINLIESGVEGPYANYSQQSGIAGASYEVGVYRLLSEKISAGVAVNFFRDDEEYLYSSDIKQNASEIIADSLNTLTIRNMQSYANLGASIRYKLFSSSSGRHFVNTKLTTGISFNRTPDRTEFDMLQPGNYVVTDSLNGNPLLLSHTHFRNGFFLMPEIQYNFEITACRFIHASVAVPLQWHATESISVDRTATYKEATSSQSYFLRGLQIKIGMTF